MSQTQRLAFNADLDTAYGARLAPKLAGDAPYLSDLIRERGWPIHRQAINAAGAMLSALNKCAGGLNELEARREDYRPERITDAMNTLRLTVAPMLSEPRRQLADARQQITELQAEGQPSRVIARQFMAKPVEAAAAVQLVAMLPPAELAIAAKDAIARKQFLHLAAIASRAMQDERLPEALAAEVSEIFASVLQPGQAMLGQLADAVAAAADYVEHCADETAAFPAQPDAVRLLARANGGAVDFSLDAEHGDLKTATGVRDLLEAANGDATGAAQ